MTSALLLVAVLVLVERSYRRWVRRTISRRNAARSAAGELAAANMIDLEEHDAAVIPLPTPDAARHDERRSG